MSSVAIIGAGIIGLMCAYQLRRLGYDVTIIDQGMPGEGCSHANTGWITLSLARPIPGPDILPTSLKWMFRRDAPLFVEPTAIPKMAWWLKEFWKYCNYDDFTRGVAALAVLSSGTMAAFDSLHTDGLEFEMHKHGLLFVFLDGKALTHKISELEELRALGFPPPVTLGKREVRDLEPSLAADVIGGILVEGERHVRPESLNSALVKWLQRKGVRILSRTRAERFIVEGSSFRAVATREAEIEAAHFVLAAGVGSTRLLQSVGVRLPILAGKGYSVTLPLAMHQFSHAIYLEEVRIAVSQYRESLRLAGTMELSHLDPRIESYRLHALQRAAAKYIVGWQGRDAINWAGLRPLTPDGLPLIGRLGRYPNVIVATGHGMLGVTFAPTTALHVASIVQGDRDRSNPFAPTRFGA